MRTPIIGALTAILVGCSCYVPPQPDIAACTQANGYFCYDGATDTAPVEPKPTSTKAHPAKKEVKAALAKRTIPAPAKIDDRAATETANSSVAAKTEAPPSQTIERSDPTLTKAKTTVGAKMEDPASAEFKDMKRAMRKNTFGKPVDTICGHVKGKIASGGDAGDRPFLYLVKEDEAYVVDGPDSAAASVYRNICD
jgi:hypothetical protein